MTPAGCALGLGLWHLLQCKLQHGLFPLLLSVASALVPVHCRVSLQPADPELQRSCSIRIPSDHLLLVAACRCSRVQGILNAISAGAPFERDMSQLPTAAAQIVAAALHGCCTVCCSPRARRLLSHAGILVYNGLVDLMIPAFNVRPALTCAAAERCQQRCACLSLCSATRPCTS